MKRSRIRTTNRRFPGVSLPLKNTEFILSPIYEHFWGRPFHRQSYWHDFDIDKIATDFATEIVASATSRGTAPNGQPRVTERELLIWLNEGAFIHVTAGHARVFAEMPEVASGTLDLLVTRYAKKSVQEPQFYLATWSSDELILRPVGLNQSLQMNDEEMNLHYGPEFLPWHNELVHCLTTRKGGVILLRGEPGTGKTTYLRHLIVSLNETHRFLYLPVGNGWLLGGLGSVEFWHRQRRNDPNRKFVMIIEDAEEFLVNRTESHEPNHVSDLLNIGDGLMGDYLQLHLICTINCPLDSLDKAMTRPGRLLAYRQFRRLPPDQARRIAESKGLIIPVQESYSLAEIYSGGSVFDQNDARRSIGFAV